MTEKIDLRKQWKHLYEPSAKKPEIVDVPQLRFLMVDGRIQPSETIETSASFQDAIAALLLWSGVHVEVRVEIAKT